MIVEAVSCGVIHQRRAGKFSDWIDPLSTEAWKKINPIGLLERLVELPAET